MNARPPLPVSACDDSIIQMRESDEALAATQTASFGLLYGKSESMRGLYDKIARVATCDASVLIVGESGTGKELIARALHSNSQRAKSPFIPVNCSAIAAGLIEAELFGHEKGSFTGAFQRQIGYFEHASGGTIFLDEITEMAPEMQVKLMRVLETGCFHRVGGIEEVSVDVRVVAATNRDPAVAVSDGSFREDLLYRLAVFPLRVPPLREREGDIDFLAHHFLQELNAVSGTEKSFSHRSLDALRKYRWPGNVRELRNLIHRAFILADTTIDVPNPTQMHRPKQPNVVDGHINLWVGTSLADAEREAIFATLNHLAGDKARAAKALGISLKTLYNRLELYQQRSNAATEPSSQT